MGGNIITHENPMIPIHQNRNAARYQNVILQPVAIPHITANRGMLLMQDNATPHTVRTTQQVLQGHKIRVLDWTLIVQTLTQLNM